MGRPIIHIIAAGFGLGLITSSIVGSARACGVMWVKKFTGAQPTRCPPDQRICDDGSDGRPVQFHTGDPFTLCVWLPIDAYITLWDAGPNGGNVHRIYPNILSHQNNASLLGEKVTASTDHCFGYKDFPLYFPKSRGGGQGKLTMFATPTLEDQPTLKDMKVPGQEMERPLHESMARALMAVSDCRTPYSRHK